MSGMAKARAILTCKEKREKKLHKIAYAQYYV